MARDEEIQRKKAGKKKFYQFFVFSCDFFFVITVFVAVALLRILKSSMTKKRWGNQSVGMQE